MLATKAVQATAAITARHRQALRPRSVNAPNVSSQARRNVRQTVPYPQK